MKPMKIERGEPGDIIRLQHIGRQTFVQSFAEMNSEENMASYLEESFSLEKLTAELENKDSEFYFALLDKEVIGYLKLNFGQAQTELKNDQALEIERIYVLEAFKGKGVGQLLCDQALQVAKERNAGYIWLGVWEQNPRAIRFYEKNGFKTFDKHIFKLGSDEQTDLMMKLSLSS